MEKRKELEIAAPNLRLTVSNHTLEVAFLDLAVYHITLVLSKSCYYLTLSHFFYSVHLKSPPCNIS